MIKPIFTDEDFFPVTDLIAAFRDPKQGALKIAEEANKKIQPLVEALEWYESATRYSSCHSESCLDNGAKAREALAKVRGE